MIGLVLLSVFLAVFMHFAWKTINARRIFNKFEGLPTEFLVNVPRQMNPGKFMDLWSRWERDNTSGVYRIFMLPWRPVLLINEPKLASELLKRNDPKADIAYRAMRPWLGDGLLLANGKRWARNRRLLTQGFHFHILKPYVAIYNDAANILVTKWVNHSGGKYFNLTSDVGLVTLDVILRCAMSQETGCQTAEQVNPYVKALLEVSHSSADRVFTPWLWNEFIYSLTPSGRTFFNALRILHDKSESIIRERQSFLEDNPDKVNSRKYLDFLDILLTAKDDDGKGLSFKQIRDEVDTFTFEGHDTTAQGIAWTIYLLGLNPEHQRKCQKEIDEVLGDEDRDITWEDLNRLTYTHQCIREAMRILPPVPVLGRETVKDMEIDGKFVPAGTAVFLHILGLHRNPKCFENPMKYDPDRFSPDKMKERDVFSYTPFSAGPRNCIGQVFAAAEERIVIAKVLRKFTVETDPKHDVKPEFALVLRSANGIFIRLKERTPGSA